MNDLFILCSLGSHVLDDATANAASGEARTLSAFACLATLRFSLRITNKNYEQHCPTRSTHIASARPIAAHARSARCAMAIAGYRFTEVDIACPAATWRTTRRESARAHTVAPAEGRRRNSSEKRRSDAGRTDAGPHRGRPVIFHSGGERRHAVPGSEACAAGSLTPTAGTGSIDPTP
ncbi:hypothetical protein [Burkholderia sp. BCC0397]|uniref:hypothetical protein n=1 Tax=Burkholderia sp. BCC0397 TaxID=486876 RepID=UPI001FC8815C|nr:hypothetical protein [Burkholderia sp. BCC0397]